MQTIIRIGTRESQLAVWQAEQVKSLLANEGYASELVFIKSEGDLDLKTPLYEMGVQGIFTRSLDFALLNNRIDLAVHSMKDVPTRLPEGLATAAILKRGSHKDLLVFKGTDDQIKSSLTPGNNSNFKIATSSIRRKAQWLHRYPQHQVENLRGNVNTRLQKLNDNDWNGAIFAAAGLERIGLRPANSIELDWMLPAPAQGAIMVVCREQDRDLQKICMRFNDATTALCTTIEREFLRTLLGGCSTPISALAVANSGKLLFVGNILSLDGKEEVRVEKQCDISEAANIGTIAAKELLEKGGKAIAEQIQHAG